MMLRKKIGGKMMKHVGILLFVAALLIPQALQAPKAEAADFPTNPINKPGWILDTNDEFNGTSLNQSLWIPKFLEARTTTERSQANYIFRDGAIVLQILPDQLTYKADGTTKVSSIQTAAKDYLHLDDLYQHIPTDIKYATQYGYFEVRAKSQKGSGMHTAFWATGVEDEAWQELEVDISEHPGRNVQQTLMNFYKWDDPNATDSAGSVNVGFDMTTEYHIYAMEWDASGIQLYVDNQLKRTYPYSPNYRMNFYLGIFENAGWTGPLDTTIAYPKEFAVDYFRAYKRDPNATPPADLLSDNFEDGSATDWTTGLGSWSVVTDSSKVFRQSATTGEGIVTNGNTLWHNYFVESKVKIATANGGAGVIGRYQDANNYYMLRLNDTGDKLQLYKKSSGTFTLLQEIAVTVNLNTWYTLKLVMIENSLDGYLDGVKKISGITDSSISTGSIGLRTFNADAKYDDVGAGHNY
jgi:beta-glucanase (GH16 family)